MSYQAFWEFMTSTELFGLSLADLAGRGLLLVVVAAVAYGIQRAAVRVANKVLTKGKVPQASILINMLRAVVWCLALLMVLEPVFGVKPTAFIAALGVGSLALSMGLQDTVSNIIGGLSIMTGRVLKPGDVITVGGFTGVVTDLTWRSTYMSDPYGQTNIIPNSVLWKQTVTKLSDFTVGRFTVQCIIEHGSNLEEVKEDIDRIARETLDDWYDADKGVQLQVQIVDVAGMITLVAVHVVRGVLHDEARTRLAAGISGRPWLKMP